MSIANRKWCLLGGLLMIIPYIFWYYLGSDAYILIHDNLDSEFVYIKHILESESFFNFDFTSKIENVMNGVPRIFLRSGLNFTVLLFAIFSPVVAYITNHMIVHLVGYLGMFLFLNRVVKIENPLILLVSSISFGMLSYYHIQYGISISGQPLLLYAFYYVLKKKERLIHWAIILIFPFYSFIVGTLPFFIPVLLLLGLIEYRRTQTLRRNYILAIATLTVLNLLVEYQLVYAVLIESKITSHRIEADNTAFLGAPDWDYFIATLKTYFKQTQYHSGTLKPWPFMVMFGIVLLLYRFKIKQNILFVAGLIITINLWVSANLWLINFFTEFNFLKTFNSERFYFMLPFLWLLLGGLLLNELFSKHKIIGSIGFLGALFVFIGIVENNKELLTNFSIFKGKSIQEPTFKEFYAENLFSRIKKDLEPYQPESEFFLSIGMHPNIAQYNGLSTLDSYQNNYDLAYKHRFRKLVSEELSKNTGNAKYFDYWGSRCYYFSYELGRRYLVDKHADVTIKYMGLDTELFKRMKGKYLISAVPIENASELGFRYLNTYESEESYWRLNLYQLQQ